jgi:hypothetical protein
MILFALLLLLAPPSAGTGVGVEPLGPGRYRLTIALRGTGDPAVGQSALQPTASRLCGGRPFSFGRFKWEGQEKIDKGSSKRVPQSLTLHQEIACGAEGAASAETAAPPNPAWQPNAADEKAVTAATSRYFAARDGGRYAEAWALLSPGLQALSPRVQWEAAAAAFNARAGRIPSRRPVALTWYNNPPNAEVPGLYAAVDFVAEAEKLRILCGYLIWLRQPDGSWRLMREEQSTLAAKDAPNATAEDLARLKTQLGCRG